MLNVNALTLLSEYDLIKFSRQDLQHLSQKRFQLGKVKDDF
jgi:hypothetical protein